MLGIILLFSLPFWPCISLISLKWIQERGKFTLLAIAATAISITIDIIWASCSSDFHTAAFILQLFLPAQIFFAVLTLIIGNMAIGKKPSNENV